MRRFRLIVDCGSGTSPCCGARDVDVETEDRVRSLARIALREHPRHLRVVVLEGGREVFALSRAGVGGL